MDLCWKADPLCFQTVILHHHVEGIRIEAFRVVGRAHLNGPCCQANAAQGHLMWGPVHRWSCQQAETTPTPGQQDGRHLQPWLRSTSITDPGRQRHAVHS